MSRFVLQPVRILQDRFVTDKTKSSIEHDFRSLCAAMVTKGRCDEREIAKLGFLRRGEFIGRTRDSKKSGVEHIFLLFSEGGTGDIGFVSKRDSSFQERIIEAFRVEVAEYDGRIIEAPNQGSDRP